MIAIIEHEVITRRGWIARSDFLDLLALAQSAPGPISLNTAVFVGYRLKGLRGAFASILGIVIPSFVIILLVALLFADVRHNPYVDAAFKGMRPAVIALIVAPIFSLTRGMNRWLWCVIGITALAVWWLGWSPIYLLGAAAIGGIIWELWIVKGRQR